MENPFEKDKVINFPVVKKRLDSNPLTTMTPPDTNVLAKSMKIKKLALEFASNLVDEDIIDNRTKIEITEMLFNYVIDKINLNQKNES